MLHPKTGEKTKDEDENEAPSTGSGQAGTHSLTHHSPTHHKSVSTATKRLPNQPHPPFSAERVKALARETGFDLCGIASPQIPGEEMARFRAWVDEGYHAKMASMARHREVRADPRLLMKETRSIVCCAVLYNANLPKSTECRTTGHVWISRYAWGDDYHNILRRMLAELAGRVAETCAPFDLRWRACVDTAPLLERALAARAGLGWIGKNGALIDTRLGSYLFLGELLVNLDLPPGEPVGDHCGECRLCMDACPGQAIVAPGIVDSRRCASYLTIEHRGEFDEAARRAVTRNVFGCDICQDVCPWNRKAPATDRAGFLPRDGAFNPAIGELAALDEAEFKKRFAGSPVPRCRYEGFRRNLAAVRDNAEAAK